MKKILMCNQQEENMCKLLVTTITYDTVNTKQSSETIQQVLEFKSEVDANYAYNSIYQSDEFYNGNIRVKINAIKLY